jgi:hypothetical protein
MTAAKDGSGTGITTAGSNSTAGDASRSSAGTTSESPDNRWIPDRAVSTSGQSTGKTVPEAPGFLVPWAPPRPSGPVGMDAGRMASCGPAPGPSRSGSPPGEGDGSDGPGETVTGATSVAPSGLAVAAGSDACAASIPDTSGTPKGPDTGTTAPAVSGPSGRPSHGSTPGTRVVSEGILAPHARERIGCQVGSMGTVTASRSPRGDQAMPPPVAGSMPTGAAGRSGTAAPGPGDGRIPAVGAGAPPATGGMGSTSPATATGAAARRAPEITAAKDASITAPAPSGDSTVMRGPETGPDNAARGSIPGMTEGIMASWRWEPGGAGPKGLQRLWPLRRRSWPGRRGWPHSGRPSSG